MTKKAFYILFTWLILVSSHEEICAQIYGGGSSVFSFMNLPYSARINALGGDNVALQDGEISMSMLNPALLNEATDKVLQLNYSYLCPGTMFGSVLYGHNFGRGKWEKPKDGAPEKPNYMAVGIHYLDYGRMKYANAEGELTGGTFTAKDILIDAIYARQLGKSFTVGVSFKPILSFYETYSSFALGADVGAHYNLPDSTLHLGLTLRNIGWQLKGFYSDESGQALENLPLNLELGLSYRFKHAPIRLHMTIHNIQRWDLGYLLTNQTDEIRPVQWYDMMFRHTIFALDIVPKSDRFWLTVSYNHRRRAEMQLKDQRSIAGLSFGAGVKIYKFSVAFAMSQYSRSNFTYQASINLDINSLLK